MSMNATFQSALDFAARQCRQRHRHAIPATIRCTPSAASWDREGERWTHWCEGFYPRHLLAARTSTPATPFWREPAESYSRAPGAAPLRPQRPRPRLPVLLDLPALVSPDRRRRPARRADRRRPHAGPAPAEGRLPRVVRRPAVAVHRHHDERRHHPLGRQRDRRRGAARRSPWSTAARRAQYLVRADGGTAHEGIFDVADRASSCARRRTRATSADSTWTRGLAWALYGFTAVHRLSGERGVPRRGPALRRLLPAPRPPGLVPLLGLRPARRRAAACGTAPPAPSPPAGCGPGRGGRRRRASSDRYRAAALTILETLCRDEFLAASRPGWEGILLHGVYHIHKDLGVDESVAWGDHFFVEALVKAAGRPVRGGDGEP